MDGARERGEGGSERRSDWGRKGGRMGARYYKTQAYLETHQGKWSYVIIPVLQRVNLHFGTGQVSVRESMIKIAIIDGPH